MKHRGERSVFYALSNEPGIEKEEIRTKKIIIILRAAELIHQKLTFLLFSNAFLCSLPLLFLFQRWWSWWGNRKNCCLPKTQRARVRRMNFVFGVLKTNQTFSRGWKYEEWVEPTRGGRERRRERTSSCEEQGEEINVKRYLEGCN